MEAVIGIDIGGSTTKIVGFTADRQLIGVLQVQATDQITSMYGALGHYLHNYNLSMSDIAKIVLTGVGSSFIKEKILGIQTYRVPEFEAIGHGGLEISNLKEALIVSLGTGTSFVHASEEGVQHLGGSGIGGGTLTGLSSLLLNENNIAVVAELAKSGNLSKVDLSIQDISSGNIPSLPPDLTASNFGKAKNDAANPDVAAGLINMVLQVIGVMAVFSSRNIPTKDIVLIGSLTTLPQAKTLFEMMSNLFGVDFIIPTHSVFATAIGAVIPFL